MAYSPKQLAAVFLFALASAMVVTAQNPGQEQDVLDSHNAVRANVSVEPLSWDTTLAAYAEAYAEVRRTDCQLILSPGSPYGENLFWGKGTNWTAMDVVNNWVLGKKYYDYATNTCSAPPGESCATYTQVVWRNTMSIGCAGVVCDGSAGVFVICCYDPMGNVEGETPY